MTSCILKPIKAEKINRLYILQYALITAIIIGTITKQYQFVSFCFTCTFVVLGVYFIGYIFSNKALSLNSIELLFTFILVFLNVIISYPTLDFDYYRKAIMFLSTLVFFYLISSTFSVNKKTVDYIIAINIAIACLYPFAYLFGVRTIYANGLTFNFSNPNLAGMYILHSLLYCFVAISYCQKMLIKLLLVILSALLGVLLFFTLARSCLIAAIAFVLLIVINRATSNKLRISKTLSFVLILSPIIIAIVYMLMVNTGVIKIFSFAIRDGKALTSRYYIWSSVWDSIRSSPLFGNYYVLGGISGQSQMHNTHLDILSSYGAIVFVLFLSILSKIANKTHDKAITRFQKIAIFAFYAVIIMGSFEAALTSGGVGMYILSGGFLILAQYNDGDA